MKSELTIVFEPAEEGGYTAYVVEVPGAISEGDTIEEAREMVMDALHELTLARRESAAKAQKAGSIFERIAPAF